MIAFADSIKFLYPYLFILLGGACIVWGVLHFRKPRVIKRSGYILNKPIVKPSFWQEAKTQIDYGWQAGRAAAEKRRQERK